jgi:signal transduction histidine kinase
MSTSSIPAPNSPWPAPHPAWHEQDHHSHVVHFYSEDEPLLVALSRFIGTALGAGDSGIVIATQAHRDRIAELSKARGLDTASAARKGRYITLDAADTLSKFMRDGWPDATLFAEVMVPVVLRAESARENAESRVVAFGEMVELLSAQRKPEAALRLEQLWNDLARDHSFNLRCGYSIAGFDKEEHLEPFLKICAEHTGVIPVESYTALSTDEERLRNITYLQQRAQVLECEIAERKEIQEALQQRESELTVAKQELEDRVMERTAELNEKNRQIQEQAELLAITNQDLRELSRLLLHVQDAERRRMARDLHDSTAQLLVALGMNLSVLKTKARKGAPELAGGVSESMTLVDQILEEVRTTSYLLHPPILDEVGLSSALQWYADRFTERSHVPVDVQVAEEFGRLSEDLETAIFRIVQECLTNIDRHAGSATASIRLSRSSNAITLIVEDQGKGISPSELARIAAVGMPGVGLRGMRERVRRFHGELEILSDEKGTRIKAVIPLHCETSAADQGDNAIRVRSDRGWVPLGII